MIRNYNLNIDSIVVGSFCDPISKKITYGGYSSAAIIEPSGAPILCNTFNGNMVLVPKSICDAIGLLDPVFPHAIGDYDYGLRAIKKDYKCFTSSSYTGYCESNPTLPKWCLPQVKLKDRIKSLYSPLGNSHPNYFFIYEHRHFGLGIALKHYITIHLRLVFPKLWKQ